MDSPSAGGHLVRSGFDRRIGGQLNRILELADQHLDMDLAFVAESFGAEQVYRTVHGDARSFAITLDARCTAYCGLMLDGQIPHAIPDTAVDHGVQSLDMTINGRIGAYIGVPIVLSDGTLYGSLGCFSHEAHELGARDIHFMRMLADLAGPELELGRERAQMHSRIQTLIDTASLEVALQPVFDIHDGRCLGVEALARFPEAYGNTETVFQSAHSVGLGAPLERLALTHAVTVLPGLSEEQFLAVNLTPQVALELARTIDHRPDLMSHLVLEITEHAAVDGYAQLREALRPLRRHGLRLAIDDAGAGYASLKHVIELEPDIIKVDRSLIDGLAVDRARRSVVSAFVLLALDLGAFVIAEGIERPDDLEAVRDLGVDAAQGYLFARPTTDRSALARWVRGRAPEAGGVSPALLISQQNAPHDVSHTSGVL
jgi:EAL domain-containing protein (putative c-di-GMP-specific phosphodiesterase class I)